MPRQHQRGQRIVDHRLVVDRQQLLRRHERQRMQPRAGAAGENDALTRHAVLPESARDERARDRVGFLGPRPRRGMPKMRANRPQSSSELAGRRAGVGYSAVVIGGHARRAAGERRLRGDDAAREAVPGRHARPAK